MSETTGIRWLVLLETAGNQRFIFDTPKMRESIGASELLTRVGREFVRKAVAKLDGGGADIEVVLATSGKALIIAATEALARGIVRSVTLRALTEAPGVSITGVYQSFDWDRQRVADVERALHGQLVAVRASHPGPEVRYLRIPVVAECGSSGLPATSVVRAGDERRLASPVVSCKRDASRAAYDRFAAILKDHDVSVPIARQFWEVETAAGVDWLAYIHADGNGVGAMFTALNTRYAQPTDNRAYIDELRRLSEALERATELALCDAVRSVGAVDAPLDLAVLVLGGDDVTVVCDGRLALRLVPEFLRAFERRTLEALGQRLTAAAGVAIVKPHYPFHLAYELADELAASAKQAKRLEPADGVDGSDLAVSSFDLHIHYDATASTLDDIRERAFVDGATLNVRPFIVSQEPISAVALQHRRWFAARRWNERREQALALRSESRGRSALPRSVTHGLRHALFQGRVAADAELARVRPEHRNQLLEVLGGKLYHESSTLDGAAELGCRLLDAMDVASFLENES